MLNKVMLVGTVKYPPKEISGGRGLRFQLVMEEKGKDGQVHTAHANVVAWDESLSTTDIKAGDIVVCEGSLRNRQFQGGESNGQWITEVACMRGRVRTLTTGGATTAKSAPQDEEELPF